MAASTKDGDAMLKIFSILDHLLAARAESESDTPWVCDLLRHPDIARMDARELGDLPFPGSVVRIKPKRSGEACRV